jgi:hypothetical protein
MNFERAGFGEHVTRMTEQVAKHTHCVYCGREMVDSEEPSWAFDTRTGERLTERWRTCPRFARNGFISLFRGCHERVCLDWPF